MNVVLHAEDILQLLPRIRETMHIVRENSTGRLGLSLDKNVDFEFTLIATLPPLYPEGLGDPDFLKTHQVRFPYIVGEMANGIATAECVITAAQSGFMGFFGAGGLTPDVIEDNLHKIQTALGNRWSNWGANLIHNPNEPAIEEATTKLFLRCGVRHVSASAYMSLNPNIVHYAFSGLKADSFGNIQRQNHVIAKLSREEVAKHFISPVPGDVLQQLVSQGKLSAEEAKLAAHLPVAEDITAEADSGGHTDNRALSVLFPIIHQLSMRLAEKYGYQKPVRVGAAGGLGTPNAVAAAFAMGAAYVLTGTVNQSAIEAGVCETAKKMLSAASMVDIEMAPAADMFELGVKLQVLKRGTLFSRRALKLYELYTMYASLEEIPSSERAMLECDIFRASFEEIWKSTQAFFEKRDPQQIVLANKNPKYHMGLVFRYYLGLSSRWAIRGDASRVLDYQLWCGPAMGAFNYWIKDSFLEDLKKRTIKQIGYNLLEGAAVVTRAAQLRSYGIILPEAAFYFKPRPLE